MNKPIYIHGCGSISIQPTFAADFAFDTVRTYTQNPIAALDPDYRSLIPALQLRRMNKSMRMAIFASRMAVQHAGGMPIDAVIAGSGLGCLKDSERFVEMLLAEEGETMNPTPFIQSTHNMAAASIALSLGCKGYNMTYVNNANSFESALLDTMLYLGEHPEQAVLLGGVDELGERSVKFWELAGYLKGDSSEIPVPLGDAATPGEIAAEGAAFFVASQQPGPTAMGRVTAVETALETDDPVAFIDRFLHRNGLDASLIDAVFLGYSGDARYDGSYRHVASARFSHTPQLAFKHVLGEFDTVNALAMACALQLLQGKQIPDALRVNAEKTDRLERILIYNQRRGSNHGLILLEQ